MNNVTATSAEHAAQAQFRQVNVMPTSGALLQIHIDIPFPSVAAAGEFALALDKTLPEGAEMDVTVHRSRFDRRVEQQRGSILGAALGQLQAQAAAQAGVQVQTLQNAAPAAELSPITEAAMDDTAGLEQTSAGADTSPTTAAAKRTRRTKAEMEAARAAEAQAQAAAQAPGAAANAVDGSGPQADGATSASSSTPPSQTTAGETGADGAQPSSDAPFASSQDAGTTSSTVAGSSEATPPADGGKSERSTGATSATSPAEPEISCDDLRALCQGKMREKATNRAAIGAQLAALKVESISAIPPEQRAAFRLAVSAL